MSAESPRHARSGGPLTIPSQPPPDRTLIDAVSGFINDVTLSSTTTPDAKDTIQWARFETADINEPTPEGDGDNETSPLLLILGYGSGVQVWLIPPNGEAQEVLSWRQGTVRILRILPSPASGDSFVAKRPLIALCDSASPGPMFCSLSFLSIRGGEQVKSIKFKNQILDVQANKHSVVVSFSERFAVFDAGSLEDRMAITTCYPCPCPLGGSSPVNPIALGDRWLAYADRKINPSKRSSGGCEGEGVSSYTATVLHAAKSLSKGLRGLGESVAHSLAGGRATSQSPSPPNADLQQPGVVTVLDIVGNTEEECQDSEEQFEPIVAHFLAHLDAIIALKFDASGMTLVTADRRGHDFHVFRINPHPCGSSLASVHHLYILHRGDTTAKVQDIALSADGRWAAISSLRGTTHVFPISPYGGAPSVRTHTPPRVVNRLSRFHRSAGLPCDISVTEAAAWFPNPRVPPYPAPTKLTPAVQLRASTAVSAHLTRTSSGRQRLSSLSEDGSAAPLLARARFGPAPGSGRPTSQHSLYLMTAAGTLVHHVLHPRASNNVPKEKVCDESGVELEVEAVAQWPLQRPPTACDLLAPLHHSSPLLQLPIRHRCMDMGVSEEERWLSQVEIVTHAGPHRRLWMGPQFVFKTYSCSGSNSSLSEAEAIEVDTSVGALPRSNPVNMPGGRPAVPVLIDEGSASSLEHSPSDTFRRKSVVSERAAVCDVQLKEDLAEAMKEDHGAGRRARGVASLPSGVHRAVDPQGTVVQAPAPESPPHIQESPVLENTDEAGFRPVVNAPADIPTELPASSLPINTTIPAQHTSHSPIPFSSLPPAPLSLDVVIPAALTDIHTYDFDDHFLDNNINIASKKDLIDVENDRVKEIECERDVLTFQEPKVNDYKSLPIIDPVDRDKRVRVKKFPTPKSFSENIERGDKISVKDNKDVSQNAEDSVLTTEVTLKIPSRSKKEKTPKLKLDDKDKIQKDNAGKQYITKEIKNVDNISVIETEPLKADDLTKNITINPMTDFKVQLKQFDVNDYLDHIPDQEVVEVNKFNVSEDMLENCKKVNDEKPKLIISEPKILADNTIPLTRESKYIKDNDTSRKNSETQDIKEVKKSKTKIIEVNYKSDKNKTSKDKIDVDKKEKYEDSDTNNLLGAKSKVISKTKNKKNKYEDINDDIEIITEQPHFTEFKSNINENIENELLKDKSNVTKLDEVRSIPIIPIVEEIKTEQQAWDMLLNEHDTTAPMISVQTSDKSIEDKPKSKKNRKSKYKPFEDPISSKTDEDSFVEIHNIIDNQPTSSNELVSISTGFEDSPLFKSKQNKSKSQMIENENKDLPTKGFNLSRDIFGKSPTGLEPERSNNTRGKHISVGELSLEPKNDKTSNHFKCSVTSLDIPSDIDFYAADKTARNRKTKSASPFYESKRTEKGKDYSQDKDVIVIDSTKDNFPEIQITRGKARKKSPMEMKVDMEAFDKPSKSWSSIAASRGATKLYEIRQEEGPLHVEEAAVGVDKPKSSGISLQDKLVELCKRTDIMVAECDAPSDLNFVEEHHDMRELPPLERLDFALDDFKLEVMRDSLLEVPDPKPSPICKINIDDILSSIKETTAKAIETSAFNYVALEKTGKAKEDGFDVVQRSKITSRGMELKFGEEVKSSDEDNTSPLSQTDSDKDERRGAGAATTQPSSKQSKPKKPRKKKKISAY